MTKQTHLSISVLHQTCKDLSILGLKPRKPTKILRLVLNIYNPLTIALSYPPDQFWSFIKKLRCNFRKSTPNPTTSLRVERNQIYADLRQSLCQSWTKPLKSTFPRQDSSSTFGKMQRKVYVNVRSYCICLCVSNLLLKWELFYWHMKLKYFYRFIVSIFKKGLPSIWF